MKLFFYFVFCLELLIFLPLIAFCTEAGPTYSESVQLAIDHAANPAGWQAPSLLVIPDTTPGTTEGLVYDGGKLVMRTATKSRNFKWNYVGQAGYKIYGPATTEAAWVTTGKEATQFLLTNGATGASVTKLLERGLGMDTAGTHDAVVEFALVPTNDSVMRPVRNPDITQYLPAQYGDALPFVKPAGMTDATYTNFKAYYENWKTSAYGQWPFPWTQLGYTFFWGNGYSLANITGMTEFIILGQTPVDIYGIYATQSYIYTRNSGGVFSSAADAQFGNGFASFQIDGTCDTLWAGHRFQKNVRTATAAPNQVIIENSGLVSGGQGLLIWSLNYDVINSGVITGTTAAKFGIAGTENIALLFKGDTSAAYGTPITTAGAVNRLTNSGTIASPGTAVKVEAGDTIITNNASGIISGGVYAIQTAAGNDNVIINGGELAGHVDLGAGTDSLAVTPGSNARLSFILNKDTAATAAIANTETVTIADNTIIAASVAGTRNIRNNDQFLIVDTNTLNVTAANLVIQNDAAQPMLTFSSMKSTNRLYLVAARDASYYTANSGNASLGLVLDTLAETSTGEMSAALAELDKSGSAAYARKLEPIVNYGVIQTGNATLRQFNQTVAGRIEQLPAIVEAKANMANRFLTGDDPADTGTWTQIFASTMHQDGQNVTSGYKATVDGVAVGLDRLLAANIFAGFCFGYAHNSINADDYTSKTAVDNSQGSLYGSLTTEAYYLNTILSFAYNHYDSSRDISFGGINRTAKSTYDGIQYSGYLEGGYNLHAQGMKITPLASLQYLRLQLNDFSESGAGALNLTTDAQKYNVLQSGLGAKIAYTIRQKDVQFIPELHARWLYDFIGDSQQTTSQFTGGGASFATTGLEPQKSSYNIGTKLNILTEYGVTLALDYDLEIKDGFHSHNGYINVRYEF